MTPTCRIFYHNPMKTVRRISSLAVLTACAVLPAVPACADIIVVAPTGSSTGTFTITQDITFTITTGVNLGQSDPLHFVFDNWVSTFDGASTIVSYSPKISISINGGAPQTFATGSFIDNYGNNPSSILTPTDGYFTVGAGPVLSVNDTLTLKAGTYTLGAAPTDTFNPQCTQTFTGDMFIYDAASNKITANTAVPEPGATTFLSLGLTAILGTLRRRRLTA